MRLLVVLLLVVGATPAVADDKAKAAGHYKQGKAFFDAKQYTQAIAEYEAAYVLDKLPAHLFNIARSFHLAGDLAKAIVGYQRFLDADPKHARAAEARKLVVEATQQQAAADAKRKADDDAKRLADDEAKRLAELRRSKDEADRKRAAAAAHLKQAEAYAQAGAWASAGDEYRAASLEAPEQLLAAAEAFRKAPELEKARAAYAEYLDRVPAGERSDQVRVKLAAITRELDEAARAKPRGLMRDLPEPAVEKITGWSRLGVRAGFNVSQGASNPLQPGRAATASSSVPACKLVAMLATGSTRDSRCDRRSPRSIAALRSIRRCRKTQRASSAAGPRSVCLLR